MKSKEAGVGSARYRMLGNAITVSVAGWIGGIAARILSAAPSHSGEAQK